MMLQLHEGELEQGLEAPAWWNRLQRSRAAGLIRQGSQYIPNPYFQAARFAYQNRPRFLREGLEAGYGNVLQNIEGTPTYYQFLRETDSTGLEEPSELAGRFGTWLRTKALPAAQKLQTKLAPIISLIPGGGAVNQAFDIIRRPADGSVPGPTTEPVVAPIPGPIMPAPLPAAPALPALPAMPPPMVPQFTPEPAPAFAPQFFTPPAPSGGGGFKLPFGLTWQTAALIGLGGLVLYKTLKK